MPSNHLNLCHPLLLLPSIFPSIRGFSNASTFCIRRPNYCSFRFSISLSNEYSGLIPFRIDRFDLAVKGTLKSLLQYHSSRASVLWCSAFFMVQLSHPYMTTGKTIALTRWTFVGKVISLVFNTLSRFFIAFLPRSKHLLISWLKLPSAVILEPQKIKPITVSIVSPSICQEVMGLDAMIFIFWILSFKLVFSPSSFTFIKRLFSSCLLSAVRVVSFSIWCWHFVITLISMDYDRGWDGWMASPTRWAWVWVHSGSLWWTGRPGVLRFMGLQRVGHDWVTELNYGLLSNNFVKFPCKC